MGKLFKTNIWLISETSVFMIVILAPLITLGIFLINHSVLVFSTKTWLLLTVGYNLVIITLLPIAYSLASEVAVKVKTLST